MKIAFYGSSLLSSYWNGAATYYRGLLQALSMLGYDITFYEPNIRERHQNRDMEPPDWCRVVVYDCDDVSMKHAAAHAAAADVVVKASGVGFEDNALLQLVLNAARSEALTIFWDVDAPATLAQIDRDREHPLLHELSRIDLILTYGGGDPVVYGYRALGAPHCIPVYNALDPLTHHPVAPDPRFAADLAFLGNRLPDREERVETFFFRAASLLPDQFFLLGGAGWSSRRLPDNVRYLGHVPTCDHNAFNVSPKAVLNVNRQSMASNGYSPATRVFEAAGAGACLITDSWAGLDLFLAEGSEALVARDGKDVADILTWLTPAEAERIGRAARQHVMREHTYAHRAEQVHQILSGFLPKPQTEAAE
ncbi:CgeB family protein [Chelativorans alearense]|uniref:CgeB family protein n=1 Tax=Chelativorans alearense TaxID=2681495 RepID=UPI0013D6FA5F|nr:glycosyltransferase [Chelativorans alearense]